MTFGGLDTDHLLAKWDALSTAQKRTLIYALFFGAGTLTGSKILLGIGGAGAITSAIEWWSEERLLVHPELMNAHFVSGGKVSALNGPAAVKQLKRSGW